MPPVASALVPLALLIALGFTLKRSRFLPEGFWPSLDRLTYWVFFPALIFVSLATAEVGLGDAGALAVSVWTGLSLVALLALALRGRLAPDGAAFTSVFQGGIRFNSYVAFLVVPVLYPGTDALTALLVGLTVPLVNVYCVTALARHAAPGPLRWHALLASVVRNPLVLASLSGIAAGQLQLPLGPAATFLETLGEAALATGLLSVGATLRFRSVRATWRPILTSTALKFVALPLATAGVGLLLGLDATVLAPLVLFQALPTASASYVLARAMHGDERLMASILAMQTLAALAWLPLVYALLPAPS